MIIKRLRILLGHVSVAKRTQLLGDLQGSTSLFHLFTLVYLVEYGHCVSTGSRIYLCGRTILFKYQHASQGSKVESLS